MRTTGTVDLLLKVKEKGKNSIGVNGGISGLSGTFIGLNYETNNFLGLGETLSANANIGDLSRNLSFGFNEPYLRNKPISVGVEVFDRKSDYNPAKAYSIANGVSANVSNAQAVAADQLQHSDARLHGLGQRAAEASVVIARRLARRRHLWAHRAQSITTFNDNTRNVFQSLAFRSGVAGPNQLERHHHVHHRAQLHAIPAWTAPSARTPDATSTSRCRSRAQAAM